MPAVENVGDVDIYRVALAQGPVARNAVADDVVDGGAAGFSEAAIVERCGVGAVVHAEFIDDPVDMVGRDAGPDLVRQQVERLGREPADAAHAFEGFGIVYLDPPDIAFRGVEGFGVAHLVFRKGLLCFRFPQHSARRRHLKAAAGRRYSGTNETLRDRPCRAS